MSDSGTNSRDTEIKVHAKKFFLNPNAPIETTVVVYNSYGS